MPTTRIHVRHLPDGPDCETLAQRRLESALGRFGPRVRAVSVRVTDLNGPKGGPDKRCLVAIRLERPNRLVLVEDVHTEQAIAIGRAVDRAARVVARAVRAADDRRYLQTGW
jgi:putative sigma-54 modulation protein